MRTFVRTVVKTFVCDYAEDIDKEVNHYARIHGLNIKSISVCYSLVFVASVVFERSDN